MRILPPFIIAPAVLANSFEAFSKQLEKIEILRSEPFFDYVHIDVMDGVFVPNTSFQEVEKINSLEKKLKFEIHLMVDHPVEEMKKWLNVNNVFRALFHIESLDAPEECIEFAKQKWEVGMVLNPETELFRAESYFNQLDVVQFMTVHPGFQGAPFVPEVKEKILNFTDVKKRPKCAVDGGVNKETIGFLRSCGAEIFNVGSALMHAENILAAYEELKNEIKI